MARKNKRHIKGLNAPKYFGIPKKSTTYVLKANAGRHTLEKSITIALFAKKTGIAKTTNDANLLVNKKEISVNGREVSDIRYPIGLNDIVSLKSTDESYLIGIGKDGKVSIQKTDQKNNERTCKIIRKYVTKKGKLMLSLHDGTIIEGSEKANVNDSVNVSNDNKIKHIIAMKPESKCIIIDGVHVGASGIIQEIKQGSMHSPKSVMVKGSDGSSFETLAKNIMVIN